MNLFAQGLYRYIEQEMKEIYPDNWLQKAKSSLQDQQAARKRNFPKIFPQDVSLQLKLIIKQWDQVFQNKLSKAQIAIVEELIEIRNNCTHQSSFSTDDTYEALYLIGKFLKAINAQEAEELAKKKQVVSRLLYQEQFGYEVRQNIFPEKEKSIRERLATILEKIPFRDASLLQDALTHSTYLQENLNKAKEVNEYSDRLEFIGHKLLYFLSTEYLYHHYQNKSKSQVESLHLILRKDRHLARYARDLNIGKYILLGKVEEAKQGYENNLLLSQIFTSVIGAYYIDSGVEAVRNFLAPIFINYLENPIDVEVENQEIKIENYNFKIENSNPKNYFQEWVQKKGKPAYIPKYQTQQSGGSDDKPIFLSEVFVADIKYGQGEGGSKKDAKKRAAENALAKLKQEGLI
ncbi:Swt1 family HEPN domain-containing protein [Dapis sp. BLCC M126]|uniref:Swt1 family HEPN domain-containing protein n=1 Tax=Dapis sp. BLCC M126 TaxID=3400189 RepID=UPI003CE86950